MTDYNGWTNYETWNVSLWIENDEGLYSMARGYRHKLNPYQAFVDSLKEFGGDISIKTPDGVLWNDPSLNLDELNEMIEDL